MEKNPFLHDEEEEEKEETCITHKPYQEETLTEAQKKRNFKGLEKVKTALRKAGANIKDYKGGKLIGKIRKES